MITGKTVGAIQGQHSRTGAEQFWVLQQSGHIDNAFTQHQGLGVGCRPGRISDCRWHHSCKQQNRSVAFVETSGSTVIENGVDPVGATEEAVGPVGIVETLQGGGNLEAGTNELFRDQDMLRRLKEINSLPPNVSCIISMQYSGM